VSISKGSRTTTTTIPGSATGGLAGEPIIVKQDGILSWVLGAWVWLNKVTSWSTIPSDNNIPTEKLVFDSINAIAKKLIKYQIPSDGIANNDTGEIAGTITFTLPDNFDYNSASFAQDGGMFAQYTLNSTAKTITFTQVPLANTCFIYYYPL